MTTPTPSPILTCAALRALELAHARVVPSLMERAGRAAAACVLDILAGRDGCVLILAGPGNNGGDGFVLARELLNRGLEVVVACVAKPERLPPDAARAHAAWLEAGGQIVSDFIGGQWALVVDALFGIGLSRPPEGVYAEWIGRINAMTCPVLALDIPSGLDADSGQAPGPVVRSSHTASFLALKPGLLTADGPDLCGEISLHSLDVSCPDDAGQVLARACFAPFLKPRLRNVHKGSFGNAGVIGGASGMLGAALLSARAALRLGAGKVFLGVLDGASNLTVDLLHPEIMLRAPGDLLLLASALAVGPGLGSSDIASGYVRRALSFGGPVVLDADALNLLAENPALQTLLTQRQPASILTPHPAEAARLLRTSVASVQANRRASAQELAARFKACVVLKGCGSVVAAPDGRWFINTTGNGGMAVAGMGDVLTGVIVALLAQGWDSLAATQAGVHLHGAAADWLAAQGVGPVGLSASETIDAARRVLNVWLQG